jgi:hypothetical protein
MSRAHGADPLPLFVLGDSLSQGVISGTTAGAGKAWPVWLARALGLAVGPNRDWPVADWPAGGMPVDLEAAFHRLEPLARHPFRPDALWTAMQRVNAVLDAAETYYERGPGAPDRRRPDSEARFAPPWWPNVASFGFTVADAWLVTPALCRAAIRPADGPLADGFLTGPAQPFYRSALRTLNPALNPALDDHSQLVWLARHAEERGIERVVTWLGANNAIEAISRLRLIPSPGLSAPGLVAGLDHHGRDRGGWTVWDPSDFATDFEALMTRMDAAMTRNRAADWRVYLGTIPHMTGAALLRGIGPTRVIDGVHHPEAWTWFPQGEAFVRDGGPHLTREESALLEIIVDGYNSAIRELARRLNRGLSRPRWIVVETGAALDAATWTRTGGRPRAALPAGLRRLTGPLDGRFFHPAPRYGGGRPRGGLASLDGLHPTVIGHGLLADLMLRAMRDQGQAPAGAAIDWATVVGFDTLWTNPPRSLHLLRTIRPVSAILLRAAAALERRGAG